MTTPRPSRRVAIARLRRLARYLATLPEEEYAQEYADRCVVGHGRRLFSVPSNASVVEYLGIPEARREPIIGVCARVRTPAGKAKQLRALAARLDGER